MPILNSCFGLDWTMSETSFSAFCFLGILKSSFFEIIIYAKSSLGIIIMHLRKYQGQWNQSSKVGAFDCKSAYQSDSAVAISSDVEYNNQGRAESHQRQRTVKLQNRCA
jgi:hypothetical protein